MAKKKSSKKNVKKNVNAKKNTKPSGGSSRQTASGRQTVPAAPYRRPEKIPASDFAASTPGIMMVAMIAVIFLSELLFRLDAAAQVGLFKGTFRFFDYVTIAVGIVFLVYEAKLGKLDLSLLSEVKRNDKGTVEIKLIDRLRALEQLAEVAEEDKTDMDAFLQALQGDQ